MISDQSPLDEVKTDPFAQHPESVQKLNSLTDEIFYLAEELRHGKLPSLNSNAATITVNAGGIGIWLAVTACICTVLVTTLFALWVMFEIADLKDTDKLQRAYIDKLRQDQKK